MKSLDLSHIFCPPPPFWEYDVSCLFAPKMRLYNYNIVMSEAQKDVNLVILLL
jgi:hypothetical protein